MKSRVYLTFQMYRIYRTVGQSGWQMQPIIAKSAFTAIVLIGSFFAAAATASPNRVDDYIESAMAEQHIPGLAMGVYEDGQVIKAQGYGLANVELNVAVRPETVFQSGSIGKQFTATAVMMLVEEGKITLDDSVTKYFPDAPASWQGIKVRNLLSHTSGLLEYESDENTRPGGPINLRADYSEDQLVKIVESFPLDFPPGDKWDYRNTNYLLLGIMIHKVTGKFYGDFLQERIFRPLGMVNTRVISEADIVPNRAAGYQWVDGALKNQDWVSPTFNSTADGTLYFNVLDLAKWDGVLYSERLLKKSSLDQMWTVARLNDDRPNGQNYGFGWQIDDINGHRVIEHSGSWQGFTAFIARYVDDKLTVVVLTNLDSGHSSPARIAHEVAGLYNSKLAPPQPIADKEPEVTAFFRAVMQKVANGKADPLDFAPEVRSRWFPDGVKEWELHTKHLGPLRSVELLERKEDGERREYTYRGTFDSLKIVYCLTLNRDREIIGFRPCKN
jgi:CubicO group peptidase (beta-lactamase class C family)